MSNLAERSRKLAEFKLNVEKKIFDKLIETVNSYEKEFYGLR